MTDDDSSAELAAPEDSLALARELARLNLMLINAEAVVRLADHLVRALGDLNARKMSEPSGKGSPESSSGPAQTPVLRLVK